MRYFDLASDLCFACFLFDGLVKLNTALRLGGSDGTTGAASGLTRGSRDKSAGHCCNCKTILYKRFSHQNAASMGISVYCFLNAIGCETGVAGIKPLVVVGNRHSSRHNPIAPFEALFLVNGDEPERVGLEFAVCDICFHDCNVSALDRVFIFLCCAHPARRKPP